MIISKYTLPIFVLILLLSYGCSTSEKAAKGDKAPPSSTEDKKSERSSEASELQLLLDDQRSSLQDLYVTQQSDMPNVFLKKNTSKRSITDNPLEGYRVQLLSTRNVQQADSVASKFRAWSDSTFTDYYPRAYVLFSQPFYKVHVGDFHDQELAYRFSRQLKKKYPGAWVVHDQIEPDMVPADTVHFGTKMNNF